MSYSGIFANNSLSLGLGGIISLGGQLTLSQQVAALFSQGEQGAWYDPSDMSTMFQDSAGTTPVTAVGQPVGLILDKSGRGNHAYQTTTTKRPLYQSAGGYSYLAFDGVDDALVTSSINFTSTAQMTVWAGLVNGTTSTNIIAELSVDGSSNNGTFSLYANDATSILWARRGISSVALTANILVSPNKNVLTLTQMINGPFGSVRNNGVLVASSTANSSPTSSYGNYPLFIGQRGGTSLPFQGNMYSMIVRGAQSSGAQIASTESYVNSKTGAY